MIYINLILGQPYFGTFIFLEQHIWKCILQVLLTAKRLVFLHWKDAFMVLITEWIEDFIVAVIYEGVAYRQIIYGQFQ